MPSDNDHLTAQPPSDDAPVDSERDATEAGFGPSCHLTHAQRVERVNAYLKKAASSGVWSAIE